MLHTSGSTQKHPLDRPLGRGKSEVSLSAFCFLFSELVQYHQSRVESIAELESNLNDQGYDVGLRVLELVSFRENGKTPKRETRVLGILQFLATTLWKSLFGKSADSLEKSVDGDNEYMIHEKDPCTNVFVSVPRDMGSVNVASYIAGIIRGVLEGASFPCEVTAHYVDEKTVFLVKFKKEVMQREAAFEQAGR
uniref:Trafficking protein particle complex subunit n=1 Tax=Triparma pacifica TaxID=91992 RepID=A0A7S2VWM7_9STRA|mmetsp:Transcript_765/g.1262  ORF Transcript_765/g.1262 Transcript_765/m.1262 type:complete len:194 (+) Transcript_765:154-735(+)